MLIWDVLEIEETKDTNAIRTAYRKKLTGVNPEEDQEGFMQLRAAYEEALRYAVQKESVPDEPDLEDAPDDLAMWIAKAEKIYSQFYDRIREESWKMLLDDDLCLQLDLVDETREAFLEFIMTHAKYPHKIWQLFDKTFAILEDASVLEEKFPAEYMEYVCNSIRYENILCYEWFDGQKEASYDDFIDAYYQLKYALDYETEDDISAMIEKMDAMDIRHPHYEVEKARYALKCDEKAKAYDVISRVAAHNYESAYIYYYYGHILLEMSKIQEAGDAFDRALLMIPDYYMALAGKADVLLQEKKYHACKDMILELLDVSSNDPHVLDMLQAVNEVLIPEYEAKLRQNPGDYDSLLDLGWCYCQNEEYEKCLDMLMGVTVDDDHMFDYTNLYGRILLCENRFDEAVPYVEKWRRMILETVDDGSEKCRKRLRRLGYANYALAIVYAEGSRQDYKKALKYIEQAIETEDNQEQILSCYYAKADLLSKMKSYEAAVDTCTKILDMEPRFYPAIVLRQSCCYELGFGGDVLSDFSRAVELYPEGARPYETVVKFFLETDEPDKAAGILLRAKEQGLRTSKLAVSDLKVRQRQAETLKDYETLISDARALLLEKDGVISAHEDKSEIYYLIALCYCDEYIAFGNDVLAEAMSAIDAALTENPASDEARNIKAYICSKQGKAKTAIRIYTSLLENNKNSCYYLFRIGAVYGDERQLKKALSYYRKVAEIDDDYPDIWREIGIIYRELAEEEEKRTDYRLALEAFDRQLKKGETEYDLIERGRMYMELGMYGQAEEDFTRVLKLNKENIYAYNGMGDIFRYQRQYTKAILWYQKAFDYTGEDNTPILYENVAQCFECLAQSAEAEYWYKKALEMYPGRGMLLEKYGDFLVSVNRFEEAKAVYEKGRKLNNAYDRYFMLCIARLYEKADTKKAHRIYMEMYRANRQDVKACLGLGRYYLNFLSKYKKAFMYYEQGMAAALQRSDGSSYRDCAFGAGAALYMMGKVREAGAYFDKVLDSYRELYPDIDKTDTVVGMGIHTYYMIGRVYALLGNLPAAHRYFSAMRECRVCCDFCLYAQCYEYHMACGLMNYLSGDIPAAVQCYHQAMELSRGNDLECCTALRLLEAL